MGRATDYSNCYIYHIIDSDKVVHYVGSTSNMNSRKSKHKYSCKTEHNSSYNVDIYKYIRANGGWDVFEMVPIHKIKNVSNATELRIAEQSEINKFSTLKNKLGSYLSREDHVEQTRIWHINNREKVLKNQRKHREQNKEKIADKERKYYENNRDKVLERRRKYREANREAINEKAHQYRLRQKELKEQDQ